MQEFEVCEEFIYFYQVFNTVVASEERSRLEGMHAWGVDTEILAIRRAAYRV